MKKQLTRIFSILLIVAAVVSPSMAQIAKKAKSSNDARSRTAVGMTLKTAKTKAKEKKGVMVTPKVRAVRAEGLKTQTGSRQILSPASPGIVKEAADIPTIYGSVIFNSTFTQDNAPVGLYELPQGSGSTQIIFEGPDATNGGVCVDGVYYSTSYISFWGMVFITTTAYDMETGEKIGEWSPEDLAVIGIGGYALDPVTETVYGITYNSTGDGRQLSKISFGEEVTSTAVAPVDGYWNSIAFDAQGQLYGINYDIVEAGDDYEVTASYLNKIDKATGEVTLVGETGVAPKYLSSSVIDHKTGRMFWNVCPADENGYMYEVNMATGHADMLCRLENDDEIMGMFIPKPAAEPTAPAECKNVEFHFDGASLSGTLTLTTPSTLFDGVTPGSGELFVMVLANGEIIAGGEPQAWNTDITIPVDLSLMGAGMYDFTVFAAGDGGEGPKTNVKNVWVGADTPSAASVSLVYENGNMELSWLPVTESVNGGYLDLDNLTYTVKRADGSVAASGLTVTEFSEAVATPAEITQYYYTVEAVCADLVSVPARSNIVTLGSIVPPYQSDYAADGLGGWTVLDENADEKTWSVYNDEVRIIYNSALEMDDWLITPPLKLEGGKAYNLIFSSHSYGSSYPERLEVKFGKSATAEGMTETIVPPTVLSSADPVQFEEMIVPDADGIYYVGFHGISDADQFYLYLSNITIEDGVSADAPGLASDLAVTPDGSGALKANITFKAPSRTMNGNALSSLTKVEIMRDNDVVKTFESPSVGESLSYDDVLPQSGDYVYTVIGYNESGAGLKAKTSVYVGFQAPAAPEAVNVVRTDVDGQALVTWTAVTTDVNGLVFPAGTVTYNVYNAEDTSNLQLVAEGLSETTFSEQAVPEGQQALVRYAVFAYVDGAPGQGTLSSMIYCGTPYDGIEEHLNEGKLSYDWMISGSWSLGNEANLGIPDAEGTTDGAYFANNGNNGPGNLFTPMVSLAKMVNPALTFMTYNIVGDGGEADENEITVSVREVNTEDWIDISTKTVAEIVGTDEGWGKMQVNLSDYAGKVVELRITTTPVIFVYTLIDNIKVGSLLDHDLKAAAIVAPAKVKTGADYKVDVTVVNNGACQADAYSVQLYADEELVETKDCETLASGASAVVSFERNMSPIAVEPVFYYAKVVYAEDENETDNQTSSVTVTPIVSSLPVVTDLSGVNVDGTVRLSWKEPLLDGSPQPVTEDFEDADSFASEYGEWTFADLDGSPVGGFQNVEIPGITSFQTTGSFWVWDHELLGLGNDTFAAHSGEKYLFALFNADGSGNPPVQNNDWAISPELDGSAQTISFYAKSYSDDYKESVAVYYSTGSVEASDFVKIQGAGSTAVPNEWTLYEASLPAGAKYFAIVCDSYDSFMLMVEVVTNIPASAANLELMGYNVYRDGVKINDAVIEDTEFVDDNVVADEEYAYVVTAVYKDKGESAASNEVVVRTTGIAGIGYGDVSVQAVGQDIVILNADGLKVKVTSVNGIVYYDGFGESKTVVTVGCGVYVVTAGKTVTKVIVR